MGTMNTTARTPRQSTSVAATDAAAIEQLTLLPSSSTPARFRLSRDTRERGMRHVAEIRQMLASRADGASTDLLIARHDQAA
jgi:hypothetical protein